VQKDSYLIVGYLKGSGNGAAVAAHTPAPVPASSPASSPVSSPAPVSPAPAPPVTTASSTNTAARKETASSSVLTPAPPVTTNTNAGSDNRDMTATGTHTAAAPAPAPAAATPPAPPAAASFEQLYEQQTAGKKVTTEKGPGAWFKSNAGPGKYYALHNSAPRGTIIKVTNPLNGRSIYAKVLEAIPQMKQNAGLIIKLSDSALEALGTNEAKFYCELSYEN
jgi:hypothetical protein